MTTALRGTPGLAGFDGEVDALRWECGRRCHGLWVGTLRVGWIGLPPAPRVRGTAPLTYTWHFDLPHADAAQGDGLRRLDTARKRVERAFQAHQIASFVAELDSFTGLDERSMHDRMRAAGLDPDDETLIAAMVAAGWDYHPPFEQDGVGEGVEGSYWRASAEELAAMHAATLAEAQHLPGAPGSRRRRKRTQ